MRKSARDREYDDVNFKLISAKITTIRFAEILHHQFTCYVDDAESSCNFQTM